jgi:hypothetical protein
MEWIFSGLFRALKTFQLHNTFRLVGSAMLLLLAQDGFSQLLTWSESVRNERAIEHVQVLGVSNPILHVIEQREDQQLRWIRYDAETMQTLSSVDISPLYDNSKLEYYFIKNDTLHALSSRWNRVDDCTEVWAIRYDGKGAPVGEPAMVHKRQETGEPRRSGLQLKLSPDSSLFLLFFDSDNERRQTEGIHFKCFQSNWNRVWEKDLRLPGAPEILQVHHFLLDNHGGVYMMSGRKPNKGSADWQPPQGGQYVLYYYNSTLNKLKQYDISLKDKQVISVDFMLNTSQEVFVAGFYSDNFQNKAAGTLLFVIDSFGGSIRKASYTPFSADFFKEMTGKSKGTLDDYYLDYLYVSSEGILVLTGEQFYTSRYVSSDPTTGRQIVEYRYNFDDVLVCMLDSTARHLHTLRVPKRQMSSNTNDPNFSYAFAADEENIYLTFNDDGDNNVDFASSKKREASLWAGSKSSVTTRVTLDYNGKMDRRTLVDNSTERLLFNPLMQPPASWAKQYSGFDDRRTYKFCRIR